MESGRLLSPSSDLGWPCKQSQGLSHVGLGVSPHHPGSPLRARHRGPGPVSVRKTGLSPSSSGPPEAPTQHPASSFQQRALGLGP